MRVLIDKATRLLRWSEKYMKTDMVYLAKGGFWLSIGQFASMAMGLLLVIGFANIVPKETYGNYKLVLSLAGIIATFTLTGMDMAVTQAVARGADGAFRTGFRIQLKWSSFMVLAALVGAIYYSLNGNHAVALCLVIVGALSPIIESSSLYGAFLNGKKDFRTGALYGVFRSLVPMVVLIATIFFTQNLILIVLAYFLSHATISIVLYLLVLKKYRPTHVNDESNIEYSKHVSVTNIVSVATASLDKILIFHYLGPVELAAYGIAFSLPAQLKIVIKTINSLAFPKMSAVSLDTIRSAIYQKSVRIFLGFGILIAAYVVAAPTIYRLIFPQYIDSASLSQGLALGYIFSPAILFSQVFFAHRKQKEIYIYKIATASSRILLLLILLPMFGVWGAVYAFFITSAIGFLSTLFLFRRLRE